MKKIILSTAAAAAVGLGLMTANCNIRAAEPATATAANQVGLIDMHYIFNNYEKLKDQRAGMEKMLQDANARGKGLAEQYQNLNAQAQGLQPGSPDFAKVETQMLELQAKIQAFQNQEKREITRKQAEDFKQVYLEVQDVVNRYAKHYNYTMVMRFNRGDMSEANNPEAIMQNMNLRQVIYYQQQDDITDPILTFLNNQYKTASAK